MQCQVEEGRASLAANWESGVKPRLALLHRKGSLEQEAARGLSQPLARGCSLVQTQLTSLPAGSVGWPCWGKQTGEPSGCPPFHPLTFRPGSSLWPLTLVSRPDADKGQKGVEEVRWWAIANGGDCGDIENYFLGLANSCYMEM